MRLFFSLIILSLFTSIQSAEVNNIMLINGQDPDYKLLSIVNTQNTGYLYAENDQYQKILIYKSSHSYRPQSVFSSAQLDSTDILEVGFECYQPVCTRYFNRRTNQLSEIYTDIIDYDPKKDIVAYYLQDKNLVIISRAFKACSKPLTYPLAIQKDSEFGIKTKLMPSGGLQLDYTTPSGKDVIKIIHPNYIKLFKDCGGVN